MEDTSSRSRFTSVEFEHFKAFKRFKLPIYSFNVLVGPNNAGKSTIITAFRILAAAIRKAGARKAEVVNGPLGPTLGHRVDLAGISVADENIFFNYDDSKAAKITFHISNGHTLVLHFSEQGSCVLIPDAQGKSCDAPGKFRRHFNCPIGFVPILGPVEADEALYGEEAARLALFNYRAARNFRNIWHHYPDKFDQFREAIKRTWPGMDISPPEVDNSHERPRLYMYCPEHRIPREIVWAGFGFQVWCQMVTHIIQSSDVSIFMIDEPDIYLHSDLQRQLMGILRNLGPDILIATHSTEIITESDIDSILVIDKAKSRPNRVRNSSQLSEVFEALGSNANPILTQLAKTRRVVFVEGKDFQVLSRFARKLGFSEVASRSGFAVVPIEGFNPDRARSLAKGMETTLGFAVATAIILDRDYRSESQKSFIEEELRSHSRFAVVHDCKELENFVLVPSAMDRAVKVRLNDRRSRTGESGEYLDSASKILLDFCEYKKHYVAGQFSGLRRQFERERGSKLKDETIYEEEHRLFDTRWAIANERLKMIPGKEALSKFNSEIQNICGVSVTTTSIIDAMRNEEIPDAVKILVSLLDKFGRE